MATCPNHAPLNQHKKELEQPLDARTLARHANQARVTVGADVLGKTKLYECTGGRMPTEGQNEHATQNGCCDTEHAPCNM
jgi:hypothetical protein